jgi:hypothetical protein
VPKQLGCKAGDRYPVDGLGPAVIQDANPQPASPGNNWNCCNRYHVDAFPLPCRRISPPTHFPSGSTPHTATLPTDARRPWTGKVASLPLMTARPMNRVPSRQRSARVYPSAPTPNRSHCGVSQPDARGWTSGSNRSIPLRGAQCSGVEDSMRSASQSRINLRAFPRCVTWCGTPTATTRAKRATMRTLSERPARPFSAAHKALPNARS